MPSMGLDFGLSTRACKRKHRWLMTVSGVMGTSNDGGVSVLPPQKSARPNLAFKEMVARHLNEDVYYPAKPDWKPINLTLYDVKSDGNPENSSENHPVFNWIRSVYVPIDTPIGGGGIDRGTWRPPVDNNFLRTADLALYDGCGTILERWVFEQAWPQNVNFQILDMGDSQIVTCDLTMRYVRAYVQ